MYAEPNASSPVCLAEWVLFDSNPTKTFFFKLGQKIGIFPGKIKARFCLIDRRVSVYRLSIEKPLH